MTLGIGAATEAPRKYRNKRVQVDGHWFDSKAEARRYGELKILEDQELIVDLTLQPSYDLHTQNGIGGTVRVGRYVADFSYMEMPSGRRVVEDVKSAVTAKNALFRWKRRHFEAEYGLTLTVIGA